METIKQKNKLLLLPDKLRMSINSAIASAAGALILLSIFADMLNVWRGISYTIMIVVAIVGWWITLRIAERKEDEK